MLGKIPESIQFHELYDRKRYQNLLPSFFNKYFKVNLINSVEKMPPINQVSPIIQEIKLQKLHTSLIYCMEDKLINNDISKAIIHEINNKLNEDLIINDYSFVKGSTLGRGGHSVVRLATKSKQKQQYAIKIIQIDKIRKKFFIKQQQIIDMINSEIQILKKLSNCQNIIKYYQAIYSPEWEKVFIVLQYCKKGSLSQLIQEKRKKNSENRNFNKWIKIVQKYFAQLANAVYSMHQLNIIHRDIKTQNILIDELDNIKIIDFNISQEINKDGIIHVLQGKFLGTKAYSPPELILQQTEKKISVKGKAIDIWSLGITLLEMLQKKHPLKSTNNFNELKCALEKQIPINQNYPQNLKNLLKGMLQRNNNRRITIQEVINNQWVQTGNNLVNDN